MANDGSRDIPIFKPGEPVSAKKLNKVVDLIPKRILGAPGDLNVEALGEDVLLVPVKDKRRPTLVADKLYAVITSEVGEGVYVWDQLDLPNSDYIGTTLLNQEATEVGLNIGLPAGTLIQVFRAQAKWWFLIPAGLGFTVIKITGGGAEGIAYDWEEWDLPTNAATPDGKNSSTDGGAFEMNLSTDVSVGTKVFATKKGTYWYFFFPIKSCP